MNRLQHQHIPEEALEAVNILRNTAALQGWSGYSGREPWSLNGIGPVDTFNQGIQILRQQKETLEHRLKRMSEDRDDAERKNTETTYALQQALTRQGAAEALAECHKRIAEELRKARDEAVAELEAWQSEKGPDGWWVKHEDHLAEKELWRNAKQAADDRIEQARLELCKIGLSPRHHPTLEDAITGAREIARAVRRDLADPPADVQEAVIAKQPPPGSHLVDTTLVFAARYAHHRNTGAAYAVTQAIKQAWPAIAAETRLQILRESHEATASLEDWQALREFAADEAWHHSAPQEP
jgi:hypothetical protein